jgi:hypothetical protein
MKDGVVARLGVSFRLKSKEFRYWIDGGFVTHKDIPQSVLDSLDDYERNRVMRKMTEWGRLAV